MVWPLDVADVACVRMITEITLLTPFLPFHPLILCAPHAQATSATLPFWLAGDPYGTGLVLAQADAAPPWLIHRAPGAAPDMELRR